ncbi:MAG: hypothetical protein ACYTDT_04945 [Planctomycetota bacterium]|jgi:hypothetical protein
MKLITILCALSLLLTVGCESTPDYPLPRTDEGQVLVKLVGVPKKGTSDPRREIVDDYTGQELSVEQGKRFQRVDYNEMEDVVVVLEHGNERVRTGKQTPVYEIDEDGFDASLKAISLGGKGSVVSFMNDSDQKLTIFGINDNGDSFELTVASGESGNLSRSKLKPGVYSVSVDELDIPEVTLIATDGYSWNGNSEDMAFFADLVDGSYMLRVIAPRLPEVSQGIIVINGQRENVTVNLTVNDLPKAKR